MTEVRRGLLAAALSLVVVACSTSTPTSSPSAEATGTAATAAATRTGSGPTPASEAPGPGETPPLGMSTEPGTPGLSASPGATGEPSATPGATAPSESPVAGFDQLLGSDGRLTMLLLGSDARPGLAGERTDTIMIATIDPATGRVSFISLPRDTEKVPIGPGRTYGPKVTGLFQTYHLASGSRTSAYRSMVKALQYTFGIEIDRYALMHFKGVVKLIDAIGGIDVNLAQPFDDPTSHISSTGLHLHAGVNHLNGAFALAFCRSRHTTTDYDRSRRQQLVIAITVTKVLGMGIGELATLAPVAFSTIETNLTVDDVPALFALAQRAHLTGYKSVVLGPRTYATESAGFANQLKIDVVRALFKRIYGD